MAKEKKITQTELNKITSDLKKNTKPKAYTINDLIIWLFDGGNFEVPLHFRRNKSALLNNVQLIIPKFRNNQKMLNFMNLNFNDLYTRNSPEELLEFLKSYIQQNKIFRRHLDETFYRFDKLKGARDRYLDKMTEMNTQLDGGDFGSIVADFDMMATGNFYNPDIELKQQVALGNKEIDNGNFEQSVMEVIRTVESTKREKDPRFIKFLNQETIDKYKLTLIDIKSLEKLNKILLVFIDENNKKKFFIDEFAYEFVISNINSIIYNDYLVPFDPMYHSWTISRDIKEVNSLRMTINRMRDDYYRTLAWES